MFGFELASSVTTVITNGIKICLTILRLLHSYGPTSAKMTVKVADALTYAPRVMGNGVRNVPPHEFEHHGRWYCQL
jgi:hypothetical protein